MIKYIMIIKVCAAAYGDCLPELRHKVVYNNWYDCAQDGLKEVKDLMTGIGPVIVNRDKITVSFICKESNQT